VQRVVDELRRKRPQGSESSPPRTRSPSLPTPSRLDSILDKDTMRKILDGKNNQGLSRRHGFGDGDSSSSGMSHYSGLNGFMESGWLLRHPDGDQDFGHSARLNGFGHSPGLNGLASFVREKTGAGKRDSLSPSPSPSPPPALKGVTNGNGYHDNKYDDHNDEDDDDGGDDDVSEGGNNENENSRAGNFGDNDEEDEDFEAEEGGNAFSSRGGLSNGVGGYGHASGGAESIHFDDELDDELDEEEDEDEDEDGGAVNSTVIHANRPEQRVIAKEGKMKDMFEIQGIEAHFPMARQPPQNQDQHFDSLSSGQGDSGFFKREEPWIDPAPSSQQQPQPQQQLPKAAPSTSPFLPFSSQPFSSQPFSSQPSSSQPPPSLAKMRDSGSTEPEQQENEEDEEDEEEDDHPQDLPPAFHQPAVKIAESGPSPPVTLRRTEPGNLDTFRGMNYSPGTLERLRQMQSKIVRGDYTQKSLRRSSSHKHLHRAAQVPGPLVSKSAAKIMGQPANLPTNSSDPDHDYESEHNGESKEEEFDTESDGRDSYPSNINDLEEFEFSPASYIPLATKTKQGQNIHGVSVPPRIKVQNSEGNFMVFDPEIHAWKSESGADEERLVLDDDSEDEFPEDLQDPTNQERHSPPPAADASFEEERSGFLDQETPSMGNLRKQPGWPASFPLLASSDPHSAAVSPFHPPEFLPQSVRSPRSGNLPGNEFQRATQAGPFEAAARYEAPEALDLSEQRLTTTRDFSTRYARVPSLTLDRNELTELEDLPPSLLSLSVRENRIVGLGSGPAVPKLRFLDLSQNQVVENRLEGLSRFSALRELRLEGCDLSDGSVLRLAPLLTSLFVARNQLSSLAFCRSLENLVYLDASNNLLSSVEIEPLRHIQDLLLESNQLTNFKFSPGEVFSSLRHLNLRRNRLSIIDAASLCFLKELYIDGNENCRVENPSRFGNLMVLSAKNLKSSASSLGLQDIPHLRDLNLAKTSLVDQEHGQNSVLRSRSLRELNWLVLKGCGLSKLPRNFGAEWTSLRWLDLNGNDLSSIRSLACLQGLNVSDTASLFPPLFLSLTYIHFSTP